MGRAARLNPRSLDGLKGQPWVEQARLEQAPVSVLLRVWVRLMWEKLRG